MDNKILLAENQKNFNKLLCDSKIYEKIIDNETSVVIFGSNGQGKSTFKELLKTENCKKNFNKENEDQLNILYEKFNDKKFEVFDDKYVNNFIYEKDSINSNNLKVILKTEMIDQKLKEKQKELSFAKELLIKINKQIDLLQNTIKNANYNIDKPTPTQQRFSNTIFKRNVTDTDFQDLKTLNYSWWIDGYKYYKDNEDKICPWCNNSYETFNDSIKMLLNKELQSSDKIEKVIKDCEKTKQFLENEKTKDIRPSIIKKIDQIIDLLKDSEINNHKNEIIYIYENLINLAKNDLNIFVNLNDKFKELDKLTLLTDFQILDETKNLKYLKVNDDIEYIQNYIKSINEKSKDLAQILAKNNEELINIIEPSKESINKMLKEFGFELEFDIQKENILSNERINEESDYVIIKNNNGKDLTKQLGEVLSYGEHSTLAFVIFLASLENKNSIEKNQTIVIFDDPISSYDIYRRSITIMRIKELLNNGYKKIFILTHENSLVVSLDNILEDNNSIFLNLDNNIDGNKYLNILSKNDIYNTEIQYYINIIKTANNYVYLINALRKLTDYLIVLMQNKEEKYFKDLFSYLSILMHYRKNDNRYDIEKVNNELNNLLKFYNIKNEDITLDISLLTDKEKMIEKIDEYYEEIRNKNLYDINLEDVLSFRILAEKAIRDENFNIEKSVKVYKNTTDCWKVKNSTIKDHLEYYSPYLNSICHMDGEKANDYIFNLFDYRFIPYYIKKNILDIIYCK